MKNLLAVMFITMTLSTVAIANGGTGILPPDPTLGQCYAKQWTPPVKEAGTVTVVTKEAYTEYVVTPATFTVENVEVQTGGGIPAWGQNECASVPGSDAYCYNETPNGTTTVQVTKLATDASVETINHPQVTSEIPTASVTTPGSLIWVEVDCNGTGEQAVAVSMPTVKQIQQALIDAGYDVVWVDGIIGSKTRAGIKNFKNANGLPNTSVITQAFINMLNL